MGQTVTRIDSICVYDASTYSISIVDLPNLTLVFAEIHETQSSTTATIGFFTRDPIGYVDGMNLFSWVGCRPLNLNDPSGTQMGWPPGKNACWPVPVERCFRDLGHLNIFPARTGREWMEDCESTYVQEGTKCGQHGKNCEKECDKIWFPYIGYAACMKECARSQECCQLTADQHVANCFAMVDCYPYESRFRKWELEHQQGKCKNRLGDPLPDIPNGPFNPSLF